VASFAVWEGEIMTTTAGARSGDQLRGELLAAATELLSQRLSVTPPSLRETARACGVSATAVYRHFPSQQALLLAITSESLASLEAAVDEQGSTGALPTDRLQALRAMAVAYATWATNNPGAYQLLFEGRDLLENPTAIDAGVDRLQGQLEERLRGLPAGGRDEMVQAELLWIALHGLVVTRIRKAHHPWRREVAEDAQLIVDAFTA
jgi:AcrR family transcriptional regulator